jgi:prolyl 4-hydroxylase
MENFIRIHEVEDPNLCDDIIKVFESEPNQEFKTRGSSGGIIQEHVKTSLDEQFSSYNYGRIFSRYVKHLTPHVASYMAEFGTSNMGIENIQVQKYLPGEGFKKYHYERDSARPGRAITFMTYLNDVKDGGTEFRLQNLTTEAKKGQTVLWPCEWTHPHRGIVSETDVKYIITGWYSYIEPSEQFPLKTMHANEEIPESYIFVMPRDHDHKLNPDIPGATFVNNQAPDYADGSVYHHPDYEEMLAGLQKRSA